jgi:hypothetical protein
MKALIVTLLIFLIILSAGCKKISENSFYKGNPDPLYKNAYIKLPLGAVKPEGWLRSQLEAQAAGLTGNVDEFWPDLLNSSWKGGDGEAWERGPYYLDGLVPLAYLLDDRRLIEKTGRWIEKIIASSRDSGWYGPEKNKDRWPLAVSNKVLMQYFEATGDTLALEVITKYFRYLHDTPPDWPDDAWRGARAMENAVTGYWLYCRLQEPWILETIKSIQNNSLDWTGYYERFPWDSAAIADKKVPKNYDGIGMTAHVVNNGMAIKYPGLWYQQSMDERFRKAVFSGIEKYDLYHGQAGGRFSGDEHLSGNSPDRGTELCSVVEYMFSLENLFAIFGDNSLADRIESLAFNALPGTTTPDMWAHQYDQQSNQVLVSSIERAWSSNGKNSNIYGLMPTYGCCLANMHQGWPKFAQYLWMATNDNGLAATIYSPSRVKAKVGNGTEVTIVEDTDYPFRGDISLTINTPEPVSFPLYLRIPGWADTVTITCKDKKVSGTAGSTVKLLEKWNNGEQIFIDMPMKIRLERRYNNSRAVLRGPLYFSLRIEKDYRSTVLNYDNYSYKGSIDWEIYPLSEWNYGLLTDDKNISRGFRVEEYPVGKYPFADKGDMIWSDDSSGYIKWTIEPPVVITSRGIKIPGWILKNNSADLPPLSPVKPEGDPEMITLVPYGSARLRITEFPLIDIVFMNDVIRQKN